MGSGVEAMQRLRMQNLDWRKEAAGEFDEFLPAQERLLTAPPKRAQPKPAHLVEEPPEACVDVDGGTRPHSAVTVLHPDFPRIGAVMKYHFVDDRHSQYFYKCKGCGVEFRLTLRHEICTGRPFRSLAPGRVCLSGFSRCIASAARPVRVADQRPLPGLVRGNSRRRLFTLL